jgi:hypothetical protein
MRNPGPHTEASRARLLRTSAVITTGIVFAGVAGTLATTAAIANHETANSDHDDDDDHEPDSPLINLPGLWPSDNEPADGGSNGS